LLLGRRLLEWLEEVAAKPAAATLRRLTLRRAAEAAEIEKLRGSRSHDPDQKRDHNREHGQRAGIGKHAQKGFWLSHPGSVAMDRDVSNIVAESGRKRADFPHKSGLPLRRQGCRPNR
jgi:hypothetical protein